MDWTQFATFMFGNLIFTLTLWLWSRGESRDDMRQIQSSLDEHRRDVESNLNEHRKETNSILKAIQEEMKDFHARLYSLEVDRKSSRMIPKEGK